ncbi:GUN4 domain-containing protein [Microcoleus sp. MON1_C1]|uniref:GUN4 domain-containing protein n=1 Tax=Microcoleus sp. MON1_C1 TaxID=2818827 RepID=UPI002FCF7FB0
MAKNWAVVIGINEYEHLPRPLKYAKRDAELMRDFLCKEAGFEKVYHFSEDSSDKQLRPTRSNVMRLLHLMFEQPFMSAGDNFWFFFSGHGVRQNGCDYLMPADGFTEDIANSNISVNYIIQRLRRCGADNIIMILDACRDEGKSVEGIGRQTAEQARQMGVISIASCSPNQISYEIEDLQQGVFTCALLEGLGTQGKCATVERLNQYLIHRVPELNREFGKPKQTPLTVAEPIEKSHLILCPKYATLADVKALKYDASQAELNQDFDFAEQLWIRVSAASPGDIDAVKAFKRIAVAQVRSEALSDRPSSQARPQTEKSPQPAPANSAPIEPDVPLKSERGVDYTKLRDLLATRKWQEADRETAIKMLEVAERTKDGWLRGEDLDRFPCEDLRTIDQLWVKYSNGRFGFSVQKRIYESLGGSREYDRKIWEAFGDLVGWRVNRLGGVWLYYNELKFNTNKAAQGHLPTTINSWFGAQGHLPTTINRWMGMGGGIGRGGVSLLSRRDL